MLLELIEISGKENGTVIIFIDQFEELLSYTDQDVSEENFLDLFLSYLRKFLDSASKETLIIGTLRSDFLKNLQEKVLKALSITCM